MIRRFDEGPVRLGVLLSVSLLAAWTSTAQAQEQDHVVLGVGVAAIPVFQGADDYRVLPLPAIDIKKGWFIASVRNGVGIMPINTKTVSIGASATFIAGYREQDVPKGIDRQPSGVGLRLFTSIRAGGGVATLGAVTGVSGGTEGVIADASLSYPIRVSSRFMLTPTVATTWANRTYNDRYFGVTAAESRASGLPQFEAASGFKDVSAVLTASSRLTDRVTLSATGGVSSLVSEAKDSPLVVHTRQPFGALALTYRLPSSRRRPGVAALIPDVRNSSGPGTPAR